VEAALDRVCRRAAIDNCRLASGEGKLFVNVLAGSLCDPDWVNGKVGGQLRQLSLEPRDLVLELSERSADSEPDRIADAIADLRSAGFGIALDDVGTGYSSLATLERIRPDYVKVDTSLVRGIEDNLIQQDALRSLVKIAGRLGSKVIAEGVETGEEAAALASIGVRYGQGFLFSRPVPRPGGMPRPGGLDH
jgi:EAL domain-containing protein (putative c-di-GMP-specific phosphodiesterase class I)